MFDPASQAFILKFLKFSVVGGSGVIVDLGLTYFFKETAKLLKYVAHVIGFTGAATSNYFLNRVWTFGSHNPQVAVEYLKFFIVSLAGLGLTTLILWALVSKFNRPFYLSKLIAIGVVTVWNFLMNLLFTFAQ